MPFSPQALTPGSKRVLIPLLVFSALVVGCAKLLQPPPNSPLGQSNAQLDEEIRGRISQTQSQSIPSAQYEVSLIPQPRLDNPTPTPKLALQVLPGKRREQPRSELITAPQAFNGNMESSSKPVVQLKGEGRPLPILTETPAKAEQAESGLPPLRAGGNIGPSMGTSGSATPGGTPTPTPAMPGATPPLRPRMNPDGSFVFVTPVPTVNPPQTPVPTVAPTPSPTATPAVSPMAHAETRL